MLDSANVIEFPIVESMDTHDYKSYQVENGNFSRVLNSTLEKLYSAGFSGAQLSLVLFVIRKTYGYGKKYDRITTTQIAKAIGVDRTTAARTLNKLVSANVIVRKSQRSPLSFNKYHFQWNLEKLHKKTDEQDCPKYQSEIRGCSNGQSQDCSNGQSQSERDCSKHQSKIDQNTNQQKTIKQKKKINIKKPSSDLKSDSENVFFDDYHRDGLHCDHPLKPELAKPGYQNPKCYAQKSTKQLQDENVEIARAKVKSGTPWSGLSKRLKVAAIFSAYNIRFEKEKSPFSGNGELNSAADACLDRIKQGATLDSFKLLFDYGTAMANGYKNGQISEKHDDHFEAKCWATQRPIETIMRKSKHDKYIADAMEWEESR